MIEVQEDRSINLEEGDFIFPIEELDETIKHYLDETKGEKPQERIYEDNLELFSQGKLKANIPELPQIAVDDVVTFYFRVSERYELLTTREQLLLGKIIAGAQEAQERFDGEDIMLAEDEEYLYEKIHRGRIAKDLLITSNMRWVVVCAKFFQNRGVDFEDLIQAGTDALEIAADKYDYKRGNKFLTFATDRIRQRIWRSIHDNGRTIRLPVYVAEKVTQVTDFITRFQTEHQRKPTIEELDNVFNLGPKSIAGLLMHLEDPLSLSSPVHGGDEEDGDLQRFIEDPNVDVEKAADVRLLKELLLQGFKEAGLTKREKFIFIQRHTTPSTYGAMGRYLNISRETPRLDHKSAEKKIKNLEQTNPQLWARLKAHYMI